jgi:hypothetical protein
VWKASSWHQLDSLVFIDHFSPQLFDTLLKAKRHMGFIDPGSCWSYCCMTDNDIVGECSFEMKTKFRKSYSGLGGIGINNTSMFWPNSWFHLKQCKSILKTFECCSLPISRATIEGKYYKENKSLLVSDLPFLWGY